MFDTGVLVLRFPQRDGDHVYRVAKMKADEMRCLNAQIADGIPWQQTEAFGPPVNLKQALRELHEVDTREFVVVSVN